MWGTESYFLGGRLMPDKLDLKRFTSNQKEITEYQKKVRNNQNSIYYGLNSLRNNPEKHLNKVINLNINQSQTIGEIDKHNAGKEYRKDKSKLGKYDNSVVAYIPLPTELQKQQLDLVLNKTDTLIGDKARIKEQLGRAIPHSTSMRDEFDGLHRGIRDDLSDVKKILTGRIGELNVGGKRYYLRKPRGKNKNNSPIKSPPPMRSRSISKGEKKV